MHDYLKCPKIVSFKVAGFRTRVLKKPVKRKVEPTTVGKIGEIAAREALRLGREGKEERISLRNIERRLLANLQQLPRIEPAKLCEQYVHQSFVGMEQIVSDLWEKYGWIEAIGKGSSKNMLGPSKVEPDMVALGKGKLPLIVEVKNTAEIDLKDRVQASFYNSIARAEGGLVITERFLTEGYGVAPRLRIKTPSKCLLIYPRLGRFEEVKDRIKLALIVKPIWEAKQLGLLGKQPFAERSDRCKGCAWRAFCDPSKAGQIEPIPPLPLAWAKGLVEIGYNLDLHWIRKYVYKLFRDAIWTYKEKTLLQTNLALLDFPELIPFAMKVLWKINSIELAELISSKLEIGSDLIREALGPLPSLWHTEEIKRARKARKEMASEFEKWKKLLPKREAKRVLPVMLGLGKKRGSFPRLSAEMVDKSWRKWS